MARRVDRTTVEVVNRKLHHRYEVLDRVEAGVVLRGTEVKSFRAGQAQLSEAHVRVGKNGEVFLLNSHVDTYDKGNDANHEPTRPRKLLLHRREIVHLRVAVERQGMTLVPARMYLAHGLIKVSVALCRGKKMQDRRQDLRKAAEIREMARMVSARRKGKL